MDDVELGNANNLIEMENRINKFI